MTTEKCNVTQDLMATTAPDVENQSDTAYCHDGAVGKMTMNTYIVKDRWVFFHHFHRLGAVGLVEQFIYPPAPL